MATKYSFRVTKNILPAREDSRRVQKFEETKTARIFGIVMVVLAVISVIALFYVSPYNE